MIEFLLVLALVFGIQLVLVAVLTYVLMKRGYLPKLVGNKKDNGLLLGEYGQIKTSGRFVVLHAEGLIDLENASLDRLEAIYSSEAPMRTFVGGPRIDVFSSKIHLTGSAPPVREFFETTRPSSVRGMEAA